VEVVHGPVGEERVRGGKGETVSVLSPFEAARWREPSWRGLDWGCCLEEGATERRQDLGVATPGRAACGWRLDRAGRGL
jgi:hypothetical protein